MLLFHSSFLTGQGVECFDMQAKDPKFDIVVEEIWRRQFDGFPMVTISSEWKALEKPFGFLNKSEFGDV